MIEQMIARGWANFIARTTGPLHLRFVLQPGMAILMAVRAGLRDARAGRPAFLWRAVTLPAQRHALVREATADVGRLFLLGAILDFVYQVLVEEGVYALELIFTPTVLVVLPYLLLRGPICRMARRLVAARGRGRTPTAGSGR